MSLEAQLKERVKLAMKAGNTLERDVFRVALGDLQTAANRQADPLSPDAELAVIKQMVKSLDETLAIPSIKDDTRQQTTAEREILVTLLPQTLTPEQIINALTPVLDAIRAAGNDGQATGVAMKHLKAQKAAVEGKDVAQAVKTIRS